MDVVNQTAITNILFKKADFSIAHEKGSLSEDTIPRSKAKIDELPELKVVNEVDHIALKIVKRANEQGLDFTPEGLAEYTASAAKELGVIEQEHIKATVNYVQATAKVDNKVSNKELATSAAVGASIGYTFLKVAVPKFADYLTLGLGTLVGFLAGPAVKTLTKVALKNRKLNVLQDKYAVAMASTQGKRLSYIDNTQVSIDKATAAYQAGDDVEFRQFYKQAQKELSASRKKNNHIKSSKFNSKLKGLEDQLEEMAPTYHRLGGQ